MKLPSQFSYIHLFAANSKSELLRVRRVAAELNELEVGAPRQLKHILEGDLNWITVNGKTIPYLWHPTWPTQVLDTWQAVRRRISSGRAVLLEEVINSLHASEDILLDIKQGNSNLENAMDTVDKCLQTAKMQNRTYIVSYSADTLRRWSKVLPYAKRVLHTFVMAGRFGLELKLGPSWIDVLSSVRFSDVLKSPHVDILMVSFPSALTTVSVQRMVSRCVSFRKEYWAGNLHLASAVRRSYLGGAHGGNIWSAKAMKKALMLLQKCNPACF